MILVPLALVACGDAQPDKITRPTSATPDFGVSKGSGVLTNTQSLNSEVGLVASGLWQLGAPPIINHLNIVVAPNLGAVLSLEAVHARMELSIFSPIRPTCIALV